MIKFETKRGVSKIEMKGHISELCADVCTFLTAMHNSLKEDDKVSADYFEYALREHIIDMVFADDNEAEVINLKKKKKEEKKKETEKDNLIESLESLIDMLEKIQGNED